MMADFEERLRDCLDDLAETTPTSHDPWGEHLRRRERPRRTRRDLFLVTAAAAAVLVAAIAIPTALGSRNGPPTVLPAASSIPGPSYIPSPGTELLAGPLVLATYPGPGKPQQAVAYIIRTGASGPKVCTWFGPADVPIHADDQHPDCRTIPYQKDHSGLRMAAWPVPAYTTSGSTVWIFAADANVTTLRVQPSKGGAPDTLRPTGAGGGVAVFTKEFAANVQPASFEALDLNGKVLGNGPL